MGKTGDPGRWAKTECSEYSTGPKAVASRYGSKLDWSAFGGHGASLAHVEAVVRFRWRLVLDVINPVTLPLLTTQWPVAHRRWPIYTGSAAIPSA